MVLAYTIADCIEEDHLQGKYIIPRVFGFKVVGNVAAAVVKAVGEPKEARRRSQFE